ncbi:MAG: radical SAM protein, partial [Caldisericia bacterium]|nr:radical SAM protein [Caldisericia bacterium]
GKIATHLIAGLGETDRQLVELSRELMKSNIIVSLFAFTPIKGTRLENSPRPTLDRYRRLQVALALIRNSQEKVIKYDSDGNIINLENYKNILKPSDFQTPGCDGCNRPYYNERPGGVIFNHPNPPDLKEIFKEIK